MVNGVSVVICTYNGHRTLGYVIDSIINQENVDSINWELIVIDNNSTDDSVQVVNNVISKSKKSAKIRVVHEYKQGLVYARIRGYQESRYNIITYIDDDNYIEKEWVRKVYEIMAQDVSVGACGGQGLLYDEVAKQPPQWFQEFQWAYAVGPQSQKTGYTDHLWGAGLTIRKEILDVLYGPNYEMLLAGRTGNTLMSGEDSELSYCTLILGYKLFYDKELTYYHDIDQSRMTLDYLSMLFKGFGCSNVYLRPYMSKVMNYRYSKSLNFSKKWYVLYMFNFIKNIYYIINKKFTRKKLKYEMKIIFTKEFNNELIRRKFDYKLFFDYVDGLNHKN